MIDTTKLRDLAQKATYTGNWYYAGCNTVHCDYKSDDPETHDEVAHPVPLDCAEYIAAANPATVLALLDELDRTKGSVAIAGAALSAAERELGRLRTIEAGRPQPGQSQRPAQLGNRDESAIGGVEMSHTPEPWEVTDLRYIRQSNEPRHVVARATKMGGMEANARRIVACINACATMPTDDLEEMVSVGGNIRNLAEFADELRKQRDELLAALVCVPANFSCL